MNFPIYPEFFRIESQTRSGLSIRIPDESLDMLEYCEILWNRFHEECPIWAKELEHAEDLCMDYSIGRITFDKKQLIKHFLMDRLYIILSMIPRVHLEHSTKSVPLEQGSLGPVEIYKIIHIRQNLGLPITKYLSTNIYRF